jgi:hypothetical protein
VTSYDLPAEMTATGAIVDGKPHIHAVMAVEGCRAPAPRPSPDLARGFYALDVGLALRQGQFTPDVSAD